MTVTYSVCILGIVTVRNSLLSLLDEQPRYGYELRQVFESRTGAAWPLNIGQVYTTLDRLNRDGLVEEAGEDADGRRRWRITEAGRAENARWVTTPVEHVGRARDELAMKLAVISTMPGFDIASIIQAQRESTTRTLQDLTRTKAASDNATSADDLAWLLVVDSMIFQAEAEIRWLDHSEQRLARAAAAMHAESMPSGAVSSEPAAAKTGVRK